MVSTQLQLFIWRGEVQTRQCFSVQTKNRKDEIHRNHNTRLRQTNSYLSNSDPIPITMKCMLVHCTKCYLNTILMSFNRCRDYCNYASNVVEAILSFISRFQVQMTTMRAIAKPVHPSPNNSNIAFLKAAACSIEQKFQMNLQSNQEITF